jgi:hypothetical protein
VFLSSVFLFDLQSIRFDDPLTRCHSPSSNRGSNPQISSTPSRCSGCVEYASRISDLEARLTSAKCQAQMVFDKASKTSALKK